MIGVVICLLFYSIAITLVHYQETKALEYQIKWRRENNRLKDEEIDRLKKELAGMDIGYKILAAKYNRLKNDKPEP